MALSTRSSLVHPIPIGKGKHLIRCLTWAMGLRDSEADRDMEEDDDVKHILAKEQLNMITELAVAIASTST